MNDRDIETITVRLDKIEEALVQLRQTTAQLGQTVAQLGQTTTKLEGTNAAIQKMMGWGLAFVGLLTAAGLIRLFLP